MPNFYNFLTMENEDINQAAAFYLVRLDDNRFKFCASPLEPGRMPFDPYTRAQEYWIIDRSIIDGAGQEQIDLLFPNGEIQNSGFSTAQLHDLLGFTPNERPSNVFGSDLQPNLPTGIMFNDWVRRYYQEQEAMAISQILAKPGCIQALQDNLWTLQDLSGIDFLKLDYITEPISIQAIRDGIFTLQDLKETNRRVLNLVITFSECIEAIRDHIFTLEDLSTINIRNLRWILTPSCINAIKDGVTTLDHLSHMDVIELRDAVQNNDFRSSPSSRI